MKPSLSKVASLKVKYDNLLDELDPLIEYASARPVKLTQYLRDFHSEYYMYFRLSHLRRLKEILANFKDCDQYVHKQKDDSK